MQKARRPSRPRAPAAVRSPRCLPQRRRNAGPAPPAAMRGPTHAHVRGARIHHAGDSGICVSPPPPAPGTLSRGPSGEALGVPPHPSCGAGDGRGGSRMGRGPWQPRCGHSSAGGRGAHLEVRRELLLLHQPGGRRDVAGTREGGFAQLGRLLLRLLSHCKRRGRASVPPLCREGGLAAAQGGAGQDQALPACVPGRWGGEGAGTALCSWAQSASSAANPLLRALLYKRL